MRRKLEHLFITIQSTNNSLQGLTDTLNKFMAEYQLPNCSIMFKYADIAECKMKARPSAAKLQLHLLAPFFAGILMSSWVWTGSTFDTWMRFIKRTCNREVEEPVKLKKHKVIAQAFTKRKMFNDAGRLSIIYIYHLFKQMRNL